MPNLQLRFLKTGLHTSVQDHGRHKYRSAGIPIGGAMDETAAQQANYLVGNDANSPVLEITLLGPVIQFTGGGQIAICGAHLSPSINGQSVKMYKTLNLKDGDILKFGTKIHGCRAYIAIGGQWLIDEWLDSYSAAAFDAPQYTPQSCIQKGSRLSIQSHTQSFNRSIPHTTITTNKQSIALEVTLGPEFDRLNKMEVAYLFGQSYRVAAESNRMGYRLVDKIPELQADTNIISSAVLPGSVQLTASGQLIILAMDAQTTGGYARILQLKEAALGKLAQACAGDRIRFVL